MVHSVQNDESEISEQSDALPYNSVLYVIYKTRIDFKSVPNPLIQLLKSQITKLKSQINSKSQYSNSKPILENRESDELDQSGLTSIGAVSFYNPGPRLKDVWVTLSAGAPAAPALGRRVRRVLKIGIWILFDICHLVLGIY